MASTFEAQVTIVFGISICMMVPGSVLEPLPFGLF